MPKVNCYARNCQLSCNYPTGLPEMVANTPKIKGQPMKTFDPRVINIRVDKTPEKGNLAPKNGDCQPSIVEQTGKTPRTFLDDMDSIAYGVEAWFQENTGYSRRVTETTLDIARKLGVPEGEIERWAAYRSIRDRVKARVIKSLLERLQGSSLADRVENKKHLR